MMYVNAMQMPVEVCFSYSQLNTRLFEILIIDVKGKMQQMKVTFDRKIKR